MKQSLSALAVLAGLADVALAQTACASLTTLFPACATGCVLSAASAVGCTNGLDLGCRCNPTNSALIQSSAQPCVIDECDGNVDALISALGAGASVCSCVRDAAPTEPPAVSSDPPPSVTASSDPGPVTPAPPGGDCDSGACDALAEAIPVCGRDCLLDAGANLGCEADDYACLCDKFIEIQEGAAGCVIGGCGIDGIGPLLESVTALCECAAANPTGECSSSGPPPASSSNEEPPSPPSSSDEPSPPSVTPPPGSSCVPATTSDCGAVATSAVPVCAQPCFAQGAPNVGCQVGDYDCLCQSDTQASLTQVLLPCVAAACPPASLQGVITGAASVCACASATPTGGDCPPPTDVPEPPSSSDDEPPSPPSSSGSDEPSTTCQAPITSDCGAVATSAVPVCAQPCFAQGAPNVGCEAGDYDCLCQPDTQASLTQVLVPCVASACPAASLPAVIAGASSVCACASATPTGGDCPPPTGKPTDKPTDKPTGKPTDKPTGKPTDGPAPSSACEPATTQDCGPVATSAVPGCAQPCFAGGAPEVGCAADDYACLCQPDTQASLTQVLVPCVATACPAASLPAVIAGASSVCACALATPTAGGDCPPPTGKPDYPNPEKPDYPSPGKPEHPGPEPEKPGHPAPEKPEHPAPEHPAPEHPAPEHPAPEHPAPEHPAPEHPAPEHPAPERPAPEHPAPEEPAPTPTGQLPEEEAPSTVPTAAAARFELGVVGGLLGALLFAVGLM